MYEVEVKVRASLAGVRRHLEDLEATPLGTVVQADTYYDAPHRSFAETDEALRIRRERAADEDDEQARLTYKGPLVDEQSKTREEFETGVERGAVLAGALEQLGFDPAATVTKRRERFALEGYTVTLDAVEGVGEFVEVETEADEETLEEARDGALAVLERLGLDPESQLRTSYLELLLESS
ncbi:class IV adenylate cyclase [Natronobiforma cellulositropha]|uniref:class IV adenylate cyclase n=1 Tax=Natronobiforma cellulositropha TaxID=1679076 RepID=UPI0021D5FDBD|nr:class IV adenylate cyclase [Natronobiforma cellulositropha]